VNKGRMNNSAWSWQKTNIFKSILRVVIVQVISGVIFGAFVTFRNPVKSDKLSANDLITIQPPVFLVGWLTFGLARYMFNKCHLDNEEAQGREFEVRDNFLSLENGNSASEMVN